MADYPTFKGIVAVTENQLRELVTTGELLDPATGQVLMTYDPVSTLYVTAENNGSTPGGGSGGSGATLYEHNITFNFIINDDSAVSHSFCGSTTIITQSSSAFQSSYDMLIAIDSLNLAPDAGVFTNAKCTIDYGTTVPLLMLNYKSAYGYVYPQTMPAYDDPNFYVNNNSFQVSDLQNQITNNWFYDDVRRLN